METMQWREAIDEAADARELKQLDDLLNAEAMKTNEAIATHFAGGDWQAITLIRDDYFETAMDELLEDIGDLPKDLPCYLKITVDYQALQQDYTSVEYDGVTYWYR